MKTINITLRSAIINATTFFTENDETFSVYDITAHLRRSANAYIYTIDRYVGTENDSIGAQDIPHSEVKHEFDALLSGGLGDVEFLSTNNDGGHSYRVYGVKSDDVTGSFRTLDSADDGHDLGVAAANIGKNDDPFHNKHCGGSKAQHNDTSDSDALRKSADALGGKTKTVTLTGFCAPTTHHNDPDSDDSKEPEQDKTKFRLRNSGVTHTVTVLSSDIVRKIRQYLNNRLLNRKPAATLKQIQSCLKVSGVTCEDIYEAFKDKSDYKVDSTSDKVSTHTIEIKKQYRQIF